jgi:hypothetical protein
MSAARRDRRAAAGDDLSDEAARLTALVRESAASGVGRRALLLRLSRLPEALSRPHHLRLAHAALDPLAIADRARLFRLPNGDVVMVWRGEAAEALQASLEAVSLLFAGAGQDMPDLAALVVALRLPAEAETLLRAVEEAARPAAEAAPLNGRPNDPLDPAALAALEGALARADVSRFMRRRRVCEWTQEGFRLRWEKRTLSLAEIAAAVAPERSIEADPWLFRRLTRTFDSRMMAVLAAPQELQGAGPFSLDLNVASILSPAFLRFDVALPTALRGQVVLNLLPADVLADPAAFLFARDFARARCYRMLLRGLTGALLGAFPLRRIGLDLLELRWSPDLAGGDAGPLPDAARVVLTRVNGADAIAWGRGQGIALFEGSAVTERDLRLARARVASTRVASPILALGAAGGGP